MICIYTWSKAAVPEKVCPENETYIKCGPNCQNVCANLGKPCYINYIVCPSGCYCDKGLARNADGNCIDENSSECQNLKQSGT